jgi:DNA-directed RNA polymerase subunit E'/Rpb7
MSLASIYSKGVLTRKCSVSINEIGKNIKEILEAKLKRELEGKCCKDGYIKEDSVQVITYSSGKIHNGSQIIFEVVIEVLLAFPVEGMLIEAKADVITKAGIKASIPETDPSPIVIFISRDHFHSDSYFQSIKENESIVVRVVGQRFELNDPFISVIGELVKPQQEKEKQPYVVLE